MKRSLFIAVGLLAACADGSLEVGVADSPLSIARSTSRRTADGDGRRSFAQWPLRFDLPADRGGELRARRPVESDIVGGSPHTGNPEVGLLLMLDETDSIIAICSGTLIEPTLFLTAAHCVDGEIGAAGFAVYFGTDATLEDDPGFVFVTRAESVLAHPAWNPDDLVAGNDIGLVRLAESAPIAPASLPVAPLSAADIGSPLHLVGWGITGGGQEDSGIKRHVVSRLDDFDDLLVVVGNPETNTCSGDSGGPAFLEVGGVERVIGVTSFGDRDCEIEGVDTRVDAFLDFIAGNQQPGEGGGFGDPCDSGDQCDSGICIIGGDAGFCSELCDGGGACPAGFECAELDGGSACVPDEGSGPGSGGQFGDACSAGDQCESGVCVADGDGGVCSNMCETDAECAAGFACAEVQGGGSACFPDGDGDDDDDGGGFPTPIPSDEGGCAAGGTAGGLASFAVLGLLLVLPRRRRVAAGR